MVNCSSRMGLCTWITWTILLWIFGTVKNRQAICLRGHEEVYCMCKIHPKPNTAANKGWCKRTPTGLRCCLLDSLSRSVSQVFDSWTPDCCATLQCCVRAWEVCDATQFQETQVSHFSLFLKLISVFSQSCQALNTELLYHDGKKYHEAKITKFNCESLNK